MSISKSGYWSIQPDCTDTSCTELCGDPPSGEPMEPPPPPPPLYTLPRGVGVGVTAT
jgi:hypothetical protein